MNINLRICLILSFFAPPLYSLDYPKLFDLKKFNGSREVYETIVIDEKGVYDFENILHIWKGPSWDCSADKENGPQILRVEASNVIVKNFAYIGDGTTHGSHGLGDPLHVASCGHGQGNLCQEAPPHNVLLDNVYGHACEDMLTIGTPGSANIKIINSTLIANPTKSSWDKTVQINFGTNIDFINNRFIGGRTCLRFKPNTFGHIENNDFGDCHHAVYLSFNDADISPMQNGSSFVRLVGNTYNKAKVACKSQGGLRKQGLALCEGTPRGNGTKKRVYNKF